MSEKQKLTLSVNKNVVEKAKEMGINISEITESVLKGFAFTPKDLNDKELYSRYRSLFDVMLPLMKKYDFYVNIAVTPILNKDGEIIHYTHIALSPDGFFWIDDFEDSFSDITKIEVYQLDTPRSILEDFIKKLSRGVERRKDNITEIEMAKRIVLAISGTMEDRDRT
jgi:hypothetical protein